MTTITVHAGDRTIGGTQIVVRDGDAELLFDCGRAYSPASDPFNFVLPRPGHEVEDLFALRLIPPVPGFYGGAPAPGGPRAVAISHAHLDHSHAAGLIDPSIPIYATSPTARIVRAFSDLGRLSAPLARPLEQVQEGNSVAVGPMRVTFVPVDHDVSGASGLLIETSDGIIAYSGDLRLHGNHPEKTLAFAQRARAMGARLLILEGTRLFPPPPPPEEGVEILPPPPERVEADVVPGIVRELRDASGGPAVVLQSAENGERITALAAAMPDLGRLYAIDLEAAVLAYAALGGPIPAPHAVYVPAALNEDAPALRETLAQAPRVVRAEEIAAAPERYLLRLGFDYFADLLGILRPDGPEGVIFLSNGAPLGRFDPAFAHLEWWAERLGLRVADAACTGHAAVRDLGLIAGHAGAPTVMSLHSHHPELMPVAPERLLLPEIGMAYDLALLPA